MKSKKKSDRGGARLGSGRPPRPDKADWVKITCLLKRETVATLHREGGDYFGKYLQLHLDRYPLPTKDEYQAMLWRTPILKQVGRRRVPVIISAGGISKFDFDRETAKARRKARRNGPKEFEAALSAALK